MTQKTPSYTPADADDLDDELLVDDFMDDDDLGDLSTDLVPDVPVEQRVGLVDLIVAPEQAGDRADRVMADQLQGLSRSRLKALIEERRVTIDGVLLVNPSHRVKAGQSLVVDIPVPVTDTPVAQAIDLTVVYEDDQLIVIDKPAGLVVHPAPGNRDATLVNALLAHCGQSLQGIGGVRRPGIVHRIDKDTTGLIVVAKTERAHAHLSAAFADHTIERAYQAIVWGMPSPREGTIETLIGRSPVNRKKMAVVTRGGKQAITHYQVLKPLGLTAALVECRLETGRTHQIRVHMTEMGHGLVGDQTYGRTRPGRTRHLKSEAIAALAGFKRQALHAAILGFTHPVTGEALCFESPLPPDLEDLMKILS